MAVPIAPAMRWIAFSALVARGVSSRASVWNAAAIEGMIVLPIPSPSTNVVLTAVAASANSALASSWSGSTSTQTTPFFAPDSGSGGTDWWPFLSK